MTIIVTRPQGDGQALCHLLNQRGISTHHHPLVDISMGEGFSQAVDELNKLDMVIFVSRHAVLFLAQALQEKKQVLPHNIQFFAIGEGTAKTFKECFYPESSLNSNNDSLIKYPEISDSEHLLKLPEFNLIDGKEICVFRGNSGRELIFQTLKQKGAKIRYNAIYQRQFISFNADEMVTDWQNRGVTGIIVTSGEALDFLYNEACYKKACCEKEVDQNTNHQTWLTSLDLFVPSQRIEAKAKQLGFINVINTQGASNAQIVKYLDPK